MGKTIAVKAVQIKPELAQRQCRAGFHHLERGNDLCCDRLLEESQAGKFEAAQQPFVERDLAHIIRAFRPKGADQFNSPPLWNLELWNLKFLL